MLCSDCEKVVLFEAPEHDSPDDLMCVICGTAVTVAGLVALEVARAA